IYVPVLRLAELVARRAEVNRGAGAGKPVRQKRAAVHAVLKPRVEIRGDIAVEKDRDDLLLLAGALAHLNRPGARRRLPVDVGRALDRLVRADAIKVAAQPAIVRLDLSGDTGEQIVEAGLRIDRWVDDRLAPQCHACRLLQKAERKRCREREAVLLIPAA